MDKLLKADQHKINEAIRLLRYFSSIIISTVSEDNQPHTSYAPYICDKGNIFIYVSGLAQHAQTLKNGHASLFFIEEESLAKNIFARTRLTLNSTVKEIKRQDTRYQYLLDQFAAKHGSTIKVLRALPDFILFEFKPQSAMFVTGFGAAYDLSKSLNEII